MWSYYGSKSKIVNYYPKPKFWKIIEPFAGSARYALKYFDRDVLIVDKYDVVIKIWKYLQHCSEKDILGLPKLNKGQSVKDFNLSEDETLFLGMLAGVSSTQPRNIVSQFAAEKNGNKNQFKIIASQLFKIKHWEIRQGSYDDVENMEATWFIDPPYQFGGHAYVENKIDFNKLSYWIKDRKGQTIVCENMKANWMNFKPVVNKKGSNNLYTTEAIWSNLKTNYDIKQSILF